MDLASLVLRLGLGIMFTGHGLQKVFGLFGGPGIKGFSGMLSGLGFGPAIFFAYLVGYIELLGGLSLVLGLSTRISATLLLITMLVAVYKVHLSKGFFMSSGGFEYPFIIISVCIALIVMGGGKYSIFKNI
jgi:putative oxidoreductase